MSQTNSVNWSRQKATKIDPQPRLQCVVNADSKHYSLFLNRLKPVVDLDYISITTSKNDNLIYITPKRAGTKAAYTFILTAIYLSHLTNEQISHGNPRQIVDQIKKDRTYPDSNPYSNLNVFIDYHARFLVEVNMYHLSSPSSS